jgi:hypothetical protein
MLLFEYQNSSCFNTLFIKTPHKNINKVIIYIFNTEGFKSESVIDLLQMSTLQKLKKLLSWHHCYWHHCFSPHIRNLHIFFYIYTKTSPLLCTIYILDSALIVSVVPLHGNSDVFSRV